MATFADNSRRTGNRKADLVDQAAGAGAVAEQPWKRGLSPRRRQQGGGRCRACPRGAYHQAKRGQQRITANSMEPRGCLAEHDPDDNKYTIRCTIQSTHGTRAALATHPGVDKVRFTGSHLTGQLIVQASAGNLKLDRGSSATHQRSCGSARASEYDQPSL